MKNYKTIRAGEVQPGDILKCSVYVWDETIKARKHWNKNFISVIQFYKVISISNNGTVQAKAKQGGLRFFSINPFTYAVDVISAFRAV